MKRPSGLAALAPRRSRWERRSRIAKPGPCWVIRRRQPIYEKDLLDPVDPSAVLKLDQTLLESYPEGYRHLAYVQSRIGFPVRKGLPGLRGAAVEKVYAEGKAWLAGSENPGDPHWD